MKIFVVNGQGGVGKDTFEKMVQDYCRTNYQYVAKISMIDMVKSVAELIGWNGGKDMRDRLFLSRLKDLFSEYNDSPYQIIKKRITSMVECGGNDVLFIDARERSDIERLSKDFDITTVLVKRGAPAQYGNHADDAVFTIDYDVVIDNSGTLEDLKELTKNFYDNYIKD